MALNLLLWRLASPLDWRRGYKRSSPFCRSRNRRRSDTLRKRCLVLTVFTLITACIAHLTLLSTGLVASSFHGGGTQAAAFTSSGGHRKLLQTSPPIPINWGLLWGEAMPNVEFNVDDPIVGYWVTFLSNFLTLQGLSLNLFGDFPVLSVNIPEFNIFGGAGECACEKEREIFVLPCCARLCICLQAHCCRLNQTTDYYFLAKQNKTKKQG